MTGERPVRPGHDRGLLESLAQEYSLGGVSLDDLAARCGTTRDRVRRWISDAHPSAAADARDMRRALRVEAAALRRERLEVRAMTAGVRCRVCLGPNLRGARSGFFITCSERCGRLWPLARYHLDAEYRTRHRQAVARWALAHPESCPPERLRSAERALAGETVARGRWTVAGSHVEDALARVGILRQEVARRWGPVAGERSTGLSAVRDSSGRDAPPATPPPQAAAAC